MAALFCVFPTESAAQGVNVDLLLGMRGGFTNSSSPLEVSSNHYFPPSYSSSSSSYAWGPTAGIVLDDRFEIRLEAARYRFHIEGKSGTPYPASGIKSTSVTDGHVWQYPVLVAYRLKAGSVRTLIGGGLSFRTVKGATTSTVTTSMLPNFTETTTVTTHPFRPANDTSPVAFHYGVGVEMPKGWISLRPELRIGFWAGYQGDDENQVVLGTNQTEFILGIRVHPFRVR